MVVLCNRSTCRYRIVQFGCMYRTRIMYQTSIYTRVCTIIQYTVASFDGLKIKKKLGPKDLRDLDRVKSFFFNVEHLQRHYAF